jgi:uroporphyrinogen III methyltransferase/synthase
LANGKAANTPVALVRWGTLGEQETLVGKLATIVEQVAEAGFAAPAIIVVGEVVQLRDSLNWYESKPLFGQTVAVASAQAGSSSLAAVLEGLGAEVLPIPLEARTFSPELDERGVPQDLSSYQWLVFSCERQVSFFFQGLRERRIDVRELKGKFVAYGSAAAEALEMKGFYPDQVLDESTPVSSLHTALPLVAGDRILHVSSGSSSVVVHSNGAVTNTVQAGSFEWDRSHPAAAWLAERSCDFLAADDVTVLSALSAFAGSDWRTKPILCVGNETEKSAKMLGWSDVIGCAEGTDLIASVVDQTKTARAAIHLYS